MEKSSSWVRKTRKLLFKWFWRFKRSYHSLFMQMFNKHTRQSTSDYIQWRDCDFFYCKSIFFNARDICIHLTFFAKDLICFQVGQIWPYKSADVVDVWLGTYISLSSKYDFQNEIIHISNYKSKFPFSFCLCYIQKLSWIMDNVRACLQKELSDLQVDTKHAWNYTYTYTIIKCFTVP